jgi:hypothetical protein
MSVPCFIHIFSNGDIWFGNQAGVSPTAAQESGTLVTCVRVNSDAAMQKAATLTGSGNASTSALADSFGKGTGASGSNFTQKELTFSSPIECELLNDNFGRLDLCTGSGVAICAAQGFSAPTNFINIEKRRMTSLKHTK